jgi:N-methylhydantoinase A
VIVPLPAITPDGMADFLQRFAAEHTRQYGYDVPGKAVEVVNCRLQAVGQVAKAPLRDISSEGLLSAAVTGRRNVYFGARHGWADADVYARARLSAGTKLTGPLVIEEMSSTTLLAPGQTAQIDRIGNIIIRVII